MISKEQVQKRALNLFSQYGLKSVNMDDLAKELRVSKKTLYQLYTSKEELVLSLFETIQEYWDDGIHQILHSTANPIRKLLQIILFRYQFIERMNPAFLLRSSKQYERVYAFTAAIIQKMERIFMELLAEAKAKNYLLGEINLTTFKDVHELTITAYLEQFNPGIPGSDEVFKHMVISQIAGICNLDMINVWAEYQALQAFRNTSASNN